VIVDGSKLHLRDVNLTNDGVYQCAVENKYGMLVAATWVHVKGIGPCNIGEDGCLTDNIIGIKDLTGDKTRVREEKKQWVRCPASTWEN